MTIQGIQITERDISILQFINDFGFCEMPHIDKRFNLKKPRNYQIINRLIDAGLVKHERIFFGRHGIFRLSNAGAKYTKLPPLFRLALANYSHDMALIEVHLKLRKQYPEAEWMSERQLKRDKFFDGIGKWGHLPDGMLFFPDGKHVAIEVELTLKGTHRTQRILKEYSAQFSVKEVWYYCADNILQSMRKLGEKMPFIHFFNLKEITI